MYSYSALYWKVWYHNCNGKSIIIALGGYLTLPGASQLHTFLRWGPMNSASSFLFCCHSFWSFFLETSVFFFWCNLWLGGMLLNLSLTSLFIIFSSFMLSHPILRIYLMAEWWKELSFLLVLVQFQVLDPHRSMLRGLEMYMLYFNLLHILYTLPHGGYILLVVPMYVYPGTNIQKYTSLLFKCTYM